MVPQIRCRFKNILLGCLFCYFLVLHSQRNKTHPQQVLSTTLVFLLINNAVLGVHIQLLHCHAGKKLNQRHLKKQKPNDALAVLSLSLVYGSMWSNQRKLNTDPIFHISTQDPTGVKSSREGGGAEARELGWLGRSPGKVYPAR
uniref:Uncharacterized protein n=1 Tax=Micrurus paraensis TaxID=1970185 RepID=A0A2D4KFH0_9SAUR